MQQPYTPSSFQPYVSAHNRARVVIVLLAVGVVIDVASVLLSALQFFFPQLALTGEEINDPEVLVVAFLHIGIGLGQIIIYIATVVVFLMWLYRAHENLPSFGVEKSSLKYSSGWAVGSFFVPFVSLVVPYRAIKELWSKSSENADQMFGDQDPPGFFPLWWGLWLVSNFANQIYFRLSWRVELSPETDAMLGVLTGLLDILSAMLAIMVVKEIDKQQMERAKSIPREFMSPQLPPPPTLEPA